MNMEATELKELLAKGEIKQTIEYLIQQCGEETNDLIYQLKQRFSTIEIENKKGVISSSDYKLESNKISDALFGVIQNSFGSLPNYLNGDPSWEIKFIKEKYQNSLVNDSNELPNLREFSRQKLDYRVITQDKFSTPNSYPYSGEIGFNFAADTDAEKIQMSIDLGINLITLGDMNLFFLIIHHPESKKQADYDIFDIADKASKNYGWASAKSRFKVEIVK